MCMLSRRYGNILQVEGIDFYGSVGKQSYPKLVGQSNTTLMLCNAFKAILHSSLVSAWSGS